MELWFKDISNFILEVFWCLFHYIENSVQNWKNQWKTSWSIEVPRLNSENLEIILKLLSFKHMTLLESSLNTTI